MEEFTDQKSSASMDGDECSVKLRKVMDWFDECTTRLVFIGEFSLLSIRDQYEVYMQSSEQVLM